MMPEKAAINNVQQSFVLYNSIEPTQYLVGLTERLINV